jgi:Protein of unknown function (DUF4246)
MKDAQISAKWKEEAISQGFQVAAVDYILSELQYYSDQRNRKIEISAIDGIWQADNLIPVDLKSKLVQQVSILENIPELEQNWHPGSNHQVLDIVHPSFYCLVFGETRQIDVEVKPSLRWIGGGKIINLQNQKTNTPKYFKSKKYQWLPSEFSVSRTGKVKIESYINNLHPVKQKALYNTIGNIFEYFVPMFEKVLTSLLRTLQLRLKDGLINEWKYPNPTTVIDLKGRRLQVILKLANIILTPENPKYNNGSWHVEGMKNERIVASGIYYYTSQNITSSRLAFRQAVREPEYEQNDDEGVFNVFRLKNNDPLNQQLGSVLTQEDRCIAFPNTLQHCVQSFELQDPSKPGYRKILVFFLVDPGISIISTLHVPPQQKSWLEDILFDLFKIFPREIIKVIVSFMDWPMDLEAAKCHCEGLMKERKFFIQENNTRYFERPFSLCEH